MDWRKVRFQLWPHLVFIIFSYVVISTMSESNGENDCNLCSFEETTGILKCAGFNITDSLMDFNCMLSDQQKSLVDNLIIENSTISVLDLDFILKNNLSVLTGIGIHDCFITAVVGTIPCYLNSLRLSNNSIQNVSVTLMEFEIDGNTMEVNGLNETIEEQFIFGKKSCTEDVISKLTLSLNDNKLEELPMDVVGSKRLKALHLSGNPLKCEFIWENIWDHLKCQKSPLKCRSLFADENSTTCQFYRQTLVPSGIFHYTLAQIFDSKIILEDECSEMNKTCDCHPFNLLREEGEAPTVYLTVNCFGRNLTELPKVSQYTWELNVSTNYIQDINGLNDSMYRNLRRLDISHNFVDDLTHFSRSGFLDRFDMLYVNFNRFQTIPDIFLKEVKESEGKGYIKIGSQLECECQTATKTKGRLLEILDHIIDFEDVVCWNIVPRAASEDYERVGNFLRMKDLQVAEVCPVFNSAVEAVNWILVIIISEIIVIFAVVIKVFYDWKSYQRTGMLPWIADKLPSLPCDGILE